MMTTRKVNFRWLVLLMPLALAVGCPGGPGPGPEPGPTQEILDLETDAFDLVNDERVAAGEDALIWDEMLTEVARAHSEDMVAHDYFSHTEPDGDTLTDRLADAHVSYVLAGENIAWNWNYPDPAQTAVDGWMDSLGHRENILREQFTHAGMGVAKAADDSYYFTQVFADYAKGGNEGPVMVFYGEDR